MVAHSSIPIPNLGRIPHAGKTAATTMCPSRDLPGIAACMCGAKGNGDRRETMTQTKITKTPFHMQIITPDLQSAVQIGLRRNKPLRGHPDTVPANDIVCTMEFRTANLFESVET